MNLSVNHPLSKRQAEQFSPESFPLHLQLLFAKQYDYLAADLKQTLKPLSKEAYRFRKEGSGYAGVTVNLYLKDADSLRPILPWLKDRLMVHSTLMGKDEMILPYQLMEEAQSILQQEQGKGLS